ncbi:lysine exporter protein LysE/YggA [Marinomonas sp. SBI22]|uniref:LysE family translocator n=1 Tax=unclassified Marinomonas TaxID=196814 RepID=UPI0007AF20D7|nr:MULTISPECIES: LysE family translocator [unclassified Marinomonas]KZM42086.1 lysine exporter protein LysE/YggA [Marinomonas sp. SBI22]KZM47071.1 lysine exporter protein LysE/YggA [Marinomonas sp. SBI8L]
MELSFFFAIALFAFVMSVTPGPNNLMLLASGAQFGYIRTLPHMFGIIIGMACLISSVLVGLGAAFELYPVLYNVLKVVGSLYLLWLAWKIANAPTDDNALQSGDVKARPMRLHSASLFQFVNPKAWTMAIGSVSTFTLTGDMYWQSGIWILIAFATMGFIAISLWAGLGVAIRQWLTSVKRKRNFNWFMGMMTAATLIFILVD